MSAGTTPAAVATPVTLPPGARSRSTFVEPWNTAPRPSRAAGQRHDDAGRLGEAVRFDIQPAEDPVGVKQRMQLDAFLRRR